MHIQSRTALSWPWREASPYSLSQTLEANFEIQNFFQLSGSSQWKYCIISSRGTSHNKTLIFLQQIFTLRGNIMLMNSFTSVWVQVSFGIKWVIKIFLVFRAFRLWKWAPVFPLLRKIDSGALTQQLHRNVVFFVLKIAFYFVYLPPKKTRQKEVRIGLVIHTFALI